jgi:hypothetical protein
MKEAFTTADTEGTENAQRKAFKPLCYLCVLCVCGGESYYLAPSRPVPIEKSLAVETTLLYLCERSQTSFIKVSATVWNPQVHFRRACL